MSGAPKVTHHNGLVRATFQREPSQKDKNPAAFEVQFNPKNIEFDKKVGWTEHPTIGPKDNALEFQTLKPAGIRMELVFDTSQSQKDVRTAWVDKLLELTNADVDPSRSPSKKNREVKQGVAKRPPIVIFRWGSFTMRGVVDTIKVTYLMFSQSGAPIRAKVALTMKEWSPDEYSAGTANERDDALLHKQLVKVEPGQTITAVALEMGTDWREIAEANDIDDPLEQIRAGMRLLVGW